MPVWSLLGAILLNAAANIFIKVSAGDLISSGTFPLTLATLKNPWFVGGIMSFGGALILYTITLRSWPLTLAYPLMTGIGFLLVTLVSILAFHEGFSLSKVSAMATIVLGIVWLVRA